MRWPNSATAPRWSGNAAHALEELAVGADRFDVVFTDVVMPGMTGIELAQEIRRHYAGLPVVLDQRLQPRAVGERQLRFRAVAKALFDRAAFALLHRVGRRKVTTAAVILTPR